MPHPCAPEPAFAAPCGTASPRLGADLPGLTGLRGVAALWVLAFHTWLSFGQAPGLGAAAARAGYLGVDLFFVLSGFVIALNYAGDGLHRDARGYVGFLWRRLARLWPVHFATSTLLLVGLVGLSAVDVFPRAARPIAEYWHSLTLTHAWSVPVPKKWNVMSWSVSAELAAYIAFPALALAAGRIRRASVALALAAAAFVALGFAIAARDYGGTMPYGMHRIAACFTAGVLLHRAWLLRGERDSRRWGLAAGIALAALIVGAGVFDALIGKWRALAVFPGLAAIVVLGVASGGGPVVRALAHRSLQYLGRISYALYLGHGVVFALAWSIAVHVPADLRAPIYLAAIAASFALAHALYGYVEEPARRALTEWADRRVSRPRAARSQPGVLPSGT